MAAALLERSRDAWLAVQEQTLSRLDRVATRWHGAPDHAEHLTTGVRGEVAALFALRRRGYVIVARRWASGVVRGDVDLIAWDGECLCFIEVKARTGRSIFPADKAVDETKKRTLRNLARVYLKPYRERGQTVQYRFDVVSVYFTRKRDKAEDSGMAEVEIIPSAFARREEFHRQGT